MTKNWGIKQRAIFLALTPATVIALGLTLYFLALRYNDVEEALHSRGTAIVRQLAPAAEYGAFSGNRGELQRLAQAAAGEPEVVAVSIYDANGNLLVSAGTPSPQAEIDIGTDKWFPPHSHANTEVFQADIRRPAIAFDDPFNPPEANEGQEAKRLGTIILELSRANLVARKREILGVTLGATLLVLLLGALLARRLGRDITEPVLALEAAVERLRSGDLDARAPRHPSGTLASLEIGFNEMAATLADIHRRSANALADSEAELARQLRFAQALLDAQADAGVGLMIIEHGKIIFCNRAAERILGYTGEELRRLPSFIQIVHPDDRHRVMHNHLRRLDGEVFDNHYDFTLVRKCGDKGYADLAVATIPAGDHFQVMAVIIDITERKRTEASLAEAHQELLIKKEEAERANQAKSRFLAAASHDLRQPLHALTLFAAELESTAKTAEHRRLATQIGTAAGAMAELLDALLDVSRLDTADLKPRRAPTPLGPLIESIADAHRQSARAKGLRLLCHPTGVWVDTDPHLLRRMVGNLIANAVRYTNHGGVLVGVRPEGDRVRIEVWDSGIGISPTHLPNLFQEFYQVANPERDAAKGLGLGLSIVDRLGRILGHEVRVRSIPHRGSVFSITLPRAEPQLVAGDTDVVPDHPAAQLAVAGTADEACDSLCGLLTSWDYGVIRARSPEELAAALAAGPDALLVDESRLDEAAMLLADRTGPLPVVLLGDAGNVQDRLAVAATLPKPIRPGRLRALLHHLLTEQGESA